MLIIKLILIVNLIGMLNFLLGIIYHKFSNNTRKGIFIFFLLKKVRLFVDIYIIRKSQVLIWYLENEEVVYI